MRYDVTTGIVIKRSHAFFLPVRCAILRDGITNKAFLPVTQTAPPQTGIGSFDVDLYIYKVRILHLPKFRAVVRRHLSDDVLLHLN